MKRRLIVRPEAELDIGDAASWYERERQGLGLRFIAELDRVLERIGASPYQFPEIEHGVRRGLLHRFPYAIYFEVHEEDVEVCAVLHFHRHPDTWKRRD